MNQTQTPLLTSQIKKEKVKMWCKERFGQKHKVHIPTFRLETFRLETTAWSYLWIHVILAFIKEPRSQIRGMDKKYDDPCSATSRTLL